MLLKTFQRSADYGIENVKWKNLTVTETPVPRGDPKVSKEDAGAQKDFAWSLV